jgi:ribosomal protein L36
MSRRSCAEQFLGPLQELGLVDPRLNIDKLRSECWNNRKEYPDVKARRPRASRSTAILGMNTENASGISFAAGGSYDQTHKHASERLQPMCSTCYQVCKVRGRLRVCNTEQHRHRAQIVRTKPMWDIERMFRDLLQTVYLRQIHGISRREALILCNMQYLRRYVDTGQTAKAKAVVDEVIQELTSGQGGQVGQAGQSRT